MYTFLLVLLILDSMVLIAAILLQSGKGNGLAATFGGVSSSADSLLGTRQAGNLLTRSSWWSGALFLLLSFVLSVASAHRRAPTSVLDQAFTPPATTAPATAPATGGATGGATPGAAGIPLTPAPSTTAPATQGATQPAAPAPAAPATKTP
ncbi:MAG TPA: preprotein translocase subunit SecG [Gemmatimonadaceae bacterium]|jgi:preprotein translocase subunit SecG|nr:preprotein translocase subunit SecG [Gemmatimonadaceae bacterium]